MGPEKHPPAGIGQQDPRSLGEDPLLEKASELIGVDLTNLGASMAEIPLPPDVPRGGDTRREITGGFVNENIQGV